MCMYVCVCECGMHESGKRARLFFLPSGLLIDVCLKLASHAHSPSYSAASGKINA